MFSRQINDSVELRLLEERHAEEFHALQMRNREHFRKWLDWPLDENYTIEQTRGFIRRALTRLSLNNGFMAGIWFEGQLAGEVSLDRIDWHNLLAEAGYSLGAEFQGRGLATLSARAVVDYAFSELKLNRVELHCAADNRRSRAVALRLGFKEEGILRESWQLNGHLVDQVVYAALAQEWLALSS